jgi:hypothetical protein
MTSESPNYDNRPLADLGREMQAKELFYKDIAPELYAAREGHRWGCFSFDEYRYRDPVLDRWIRRLGDIFFQRNGAPNIEALRRQYLSKEEIAVIEEEEASSEAF